MTQDELVKLARHIGTLWVNDHDGTHYYFGVPGTGSFGSGTVYKRIIQNPDWDWTTQDEARLEKWGWYTSTANPLALYDTHEEAIGAASLSIATLAYAFVDFVREAPRGTSEAA